MFNFELIDMLRSIFRVQGTFIKDLTQLGGGDNIVILVLKLEEKLTKGGWGSNLGQICVTSLM